ncbi:uncharacterized protein LOC128683326 [Plodia interpunctella]|uniref:uncharacterized protein LOC128683326 n=1 Tax=Plodia interpunctella TaxID=58824 RepID=UPI0023685A04|nr:uncharacterized protein LOC128683326 [Plodia interpunctella]
MDAISQLCKNMEELKSMFNSRMTSFEQSLDGSATADNSSVSNSEYQTFKTFIWKAVSSLSSQMDLVLCALDEFEMRSRSSMLLLHGLAEEKDEDIADILIKLCRDKLNISVTSNSFSACWRMGGYPKADKPRPILLRCGDISFRRDIWSAKKLLKGSGLTFSEFLTAPRHAVFVEARKALGISGCWTSDGKIVVVTVKGSRKKITTRAQLTAVIEEHAAAKCSDKPAATVAVEDISNTAPSSKKAGPPSFKSTRAPSARLHSKPSRV